MTTREEYQKRCNNLMAQLAPNSIAIIPSAQEIIRNGDSHFRYRQDSDFYYLTGFNEPEAVLLLSQEGNILFNRPRNPEMEQWTGKRLGQEGAITELGMDESFDIDTFTSQLPTLIEGKANIYLSLTRHPELYTQVQTAINILSEQARRGLKAPEQLYNLDPILGEMRLIKSASEQETMRRAAEISVDAHRKAMKICKDSNNECQLEATLLHEFLHQGCRYYAYNPIVGGGENACILHYDSNNQPLNSGDLVLIDAGGEYQNYAADITRTFPVSGTFSKEQRAIYDLVLEAHQAGIAMVKPGTIWNTIQEKIVQIITQGLVALDILHGDVDALIAKHEYKQFYMHNSGHWLGLDVHDVGHYKINDEWRPLLPGMVLTVEPGIYIDPSIKDIDPKWSGIGVRIEDDVLVTENGHENLTEALPVKADDIEALMRG